MTLNGLRIALVGPLPPPEGGMANQTRQLAELLQKEGGEVHLVQTNSPYRPARIGSIRGVRALFRLVPYAVELLQVCREVDVVHIMANSGWSWHLMAAPAVWIARLQGVPSVVNYHGGAAEAFLDRSGALVLKTLRHASALAVPSAFLQPVFRCRGIRTEIVPNIVDTEHFHPGPARVGALPHLVVARGLEAIYDIGTALRAFALIRKELPAAKFTIAGSGPELPALQRLAAELAVSESVAFCGRLDRHRMAELYRSANVVMNPSRVDNMPGSVLEAMASGVPVVTTDAGGIPFIVRNDATALLVRPGDPAGMAAAVLRLLRDRTFAQRVSDAALNDVQQYTWPRIRQQWAAVYASVLSAAPGEARSA